MNKKAFNRALFVVLLFVLITGSLRASASCSDVQEGDTVVKMKEECGIAPLEHRFLSLREELYAYKDESGTSTLIFSVVNLIVVHVDNEYNG